MTATFPTGYGTLCIPLQQLHDHHVQHGMDGEYARRLFAWIASTNGQIGIGAAWRRTPSNTSAASRAGHSFHQTQRFPNETAFAAVDLVARNPGHVHRAPHWMEVPAQGSSEANRWGVHCNVGQSPHGEPWHMQPIELDGWQTWNAHKAPIGSHPLPHGAPTMAQPPHTVPAPTHDGMHPQATMKQGDESLMVAYLQIQLRGWHHSDHRVRDPGNPDGKFGPRTASSLQDWQHHVGQVKPDGIYGVKTEAAWVRVAKYLEAMSHH